MSTTRTATLHRWYDLPVEELKPGLGRRVITGDRMMIAHVYLEQGSVVPWHSHENEQLTYVLQGTLQFHLGTKSDPQEVIVHEGEVLVIPSNLPHKAVALEDTLDVDVFCPPRADWMDGSDTYIRKH